MLTRSKPLQRRTGLTRTGFARKPKSPFSSLANAKTTLQRTAIKKRARKPKPGDDKRMRDACREEPCYLRFPGICPCRYPEETIVAAHRNQDKGEGLKNPDRLTLPACFWCHYEYDQGKRFLRPYKRERWDAGFVEWEPVRAGKLGIEYQSSTEISCVG